MALPGNKRTCGMTSSPRKGEMPVFTYPALILVLEIAYSYAYFMLRGMSFGLMMHRVANTLCSAHAIFTLNTPKTMASSGCRIRDVWGRKRMISILLAIDSLATSIW
jgi:hypothetical protein